MDDIQEKDELADYLSQPRENVLNPLVWWWDHRKMFPQLSKMAFDFLSAPGMLRRFTLNYFFELDILLRLATSTAVERVFSQGRHLLPFTRNRLSGHSIRALLCLGDWSRKNLVDNEIIVKALDPKNKRKREVIELLSDEEDNDEDNQ